MSRWTTSLLAAAVAGALSTALVSSAGAAQQRKEPAAATRTAEPSTWDKTKDMTRRQWNKAKTAWAKEKEKWRDCNAEARKEKLSGTKRWTSIGKCMTK